MTKIFTQDDLLKYIYGETSNEDREMIEILIHTNIDFQEKYEQLLDVKNDIDLLAKAPSNGVVERILSFSREYNLHSV